MFKNVSQGDTSKLWRNIIPPKPLQKKDSLDSQRNSHIFKNVSNSYNWGEMSPKLGRNISKTAPKETQFGDPEIQKKMLKRDASKLKRNISKNCSTGTNVRRFREPVKYGKIHLSLGY